MNIFDPYQTAALLTFLSTGLLACFVLAKGAERPVTRLFGIYTLAISIWSFCWFKMISSETYSESLLWCRFVQYDASFIPATFLHFVQYLLSIHNERKQILLRRLFYGMGVLFLSLAFVSGFIKSVVPKPHFIHYLVPGPYYVTFLLFFVIAITTTNFLLMAFRSSRGFQKTQIGYVFAAYVLAYSGGTTVFLPAYDLPMPWFALYSIPLSHAMIAYAIFKHQLMDMNIVIRKTLLYSLVSAALASVYGGTLTLLAHVLGGRHGSASVFSSVLAAIFITLLFNPLRIRTQRWIDRHFPRERLDPELLQEAAGGFAHEMKRPLAKISLPAELALMDLERVKSGEKSFTDALPALEKHLRFIISQSVDAGYIIEAIRELSASSAAPFEPVNLQEPLRNAISAVKDLLEKRHASIHVGLPGNLPMVLGRDKQLEIVFVNLIKNAAEAMSELTHGQPREIRIDAHVEASIVVICIKDSGPGIKPENREKIFQSRYTTKGANGTGVGLYLSRQIIEAHRGTIEMHGELDRGTQFIVQLPLYTQKERE